LDLLFQEDKETDTPRRYECELQLGATDETHIIRTIEYWDIERKRYPQYDHVAVLVAEEVTGRFLNVIHLFNGFIPLIVLKMTAYEIDGDIALTFVKVLDEVQLGVEENDVSEPADRPYWENKSCKEMLKLTDQLFSIVQAIDPVAKLNYNKHYIGLKRNNNAENYCWFKPKKNYVCWIFKQIPSDEDISALGNAGLDVTPKEKWNELWIKITADPNSEQKVLIKKIIEQSRKAYGI
jgi:predicted transport protein